MDHGRGTLGKSKSRVNAVSKACFPDNSYLWVPRLIDF